MTDATPNGRKKSKYALPVVLLIMAALLIVQNIRPKKVITANEPGRKKDSLRPYRVISSINDSQQLMSYIFHQSADDEMNCKECSAVIRAIDPAKDDYKTYCKSVINDIVKTMGTDHIEITLYDDDKAYELLEIQSAQQMEMLTDVDFDSVSQHVVATYYGARGDYVDNHLLHYYPQAGNRYTAQEIYFPEK